MVNKKIRLGILAMTLVFGMTVVGCDDGRDDGFTNGNSNDASLNGTWVMDDSKLILNNGRFESSVKGIPNAKGIYTTSGDNITITFTHLYITEEHNRNKYDFKSKWYSEKELKSIVGNDPYWQALFPFSPSTDKYSLTGNTLTFTNEYGPKIYTRKN